MIPFDDDQLLALGALLAEMRRHLRNRDRVGAFYGDSAGKLGEVAARLVRLLCPECGGEGAVMDGPIAHDDLHVLQRQHLVPCPFCGEIRQPEETS